MGALNINQLTAHTPLQPLYTLYGEEELLRLETLDTLRAIAKQQGYLHRYTVTVESNTFNWQEWRSYAYSPSLFAQLKLLEIHIPNSKLSKTITDALQELAEDLPTDSLTFIILPKLDKNQQQSKWFTTLSRHGITLEAKSIGLAELPAWIGERLRLRGLDAQSETLSFFAQLIEGNLLAASQEIDKLALIYPKGHLLSLSDIEQTVANVSRFDVFQLSSAWLSGNMPRVIQLLDGLMADGAEPILLVWVLAEDIRILIRLSAALRQGESLQSISKQLRLWGNKSTIMSQASIRLSTLRLMTALQICAQIDRQIKGIENGDAWATLRQLFLELTT